MVVLEDRLTDRPFDIALVLSGGNALGAYQGGAYQALHDRGMQPSWIAGASAGAVNGAMICGNAADRRVDRLRTLWACGPMVEDALDLPGMVETSRRSLSAMATLAFGHPGFFTPRHLLGAWWNPLGSNEPASLYDLRPLEDTLRRLVDFDLLNAGAPRLTLTAVDVRSGEDVAFHSGVDRIGPAHVRASASLLPVFPPVAIGDRLLADAGISANLPLDVILAEKWERPLLCIAIDLLPLRATWPSTLGDVASRAQDLVFATQSRRALAAWQAIFDAHGDAPPHRLSRARPRGRGQGVRLFDVVVTGTVARWHGGYGKNARCAGQRGDQDRSPRPNHLPGGGR